MEDLAAGPWAAVATVMASVVAAIGASKAERWKDRKARDEAASKIEVARIESDERRYVTTLREIKERLAASETRNDECEERARQCDVKIAKLTGTQYTLLADIAMLRTTLTAHNIPIPEPPLIDEARLPALWPREP